jgi:hypothetical protein
VFKLHEIRVAAGCAIADGKALVRTDSGFLLMTFHPRSRIAPNVAGDGWALDADDEPTKE